MLWRLIYTLGTSVLMCAAALGEPITIRGLHAGQSPTEVMDVLGDLKGFYFVVGAGDSKRCNDPEKIFVFETANSSQTPRGLGNRNWLPTDFPHNKFEGCYDFLAPGSNTAAEIRFQDSQVVSTTYKCQFYQGCGLALGVLVQKLQASQSVKLNLEVNPNHDPRFYLSNAYKGVSEFGEMVRIREEGVISIFSGMSSFFEQRMIEPTFR